MGNWAKQILALGVSVQLFACGGGKSSSSEAAPEEAPTGEQDPQPAPSPQAPTPPINKGESTDVIVEADAGQTSTPSLTLFNVNNSRISWNESTVTGTTYQIFQRQESGSYDHSQPWNSIYDISTLDLPELPGTLCYKVRAIFPADQGSVESNEVCIRGPALLVVDDFPSATLAATQTFSMLVIARGGSSPAVFSCAQICPEGLQVSENGQISWTPLTSQMGTHRFTIAVSSGSQSLQKEMIVTVGEPPLIFVNPASQRLTAPSTLNLNLSAQADNLPITFSCKAPCPAGLTISSSGALSWTPTFAQLGLHQVTILVQTSAQSIERVLSIQVDEPPLTFSSVAALQVVATEGLNFSLMASASGQPVTYSCVSSCPEGLLLNPATGAVTWTPLSSQSGTFSPVFRASSGTQNLENSIDIQVLSAFINLTVNSSSTLIGEGNIVISASSNGNLAGTPVWDILQEAGPTVSLSQSGQQWSFLAPNVRSATDFRFKVTATIGSVSRSETIELRILPNDHAPQWSPIDHQNLVASQAFQMPVPAHDDDGDSLSYSCILDCPIGFAVDTLTGQLNWTPALDQIGSYSPTLQVESNGRTATQTLSLLVMAPSMTIQASPISGISGDTSTITIAVTSNLAGPFQYSVNQISGPTLMLEGSGNSRNFLVPPLNFPASITIDLTVSNGIFSQTQTISGRLDPLPIAPTVNVGPDLITRQTIGISPEVSPNSQTLTWTKVSGPGTVTFSQPTSASTQVSASLDGVYILRLTARNSWEQTGSDDLQLTWDTTAPNVDAGDDRVANGSVVRSATVSGHSTVLWSRVSGPGTLNFTAPTAVSTSMTTSVEGEYLVRLTASDEAGNTASSDFILTFDFTPPSIDLGPPLLSNTATVNVRANLADDTESQVWSKISGPGTTNFTDADQAETNVTFSDDGVHVLQLVAIDTATNSNSSQLNITIDRQAPILGALNSGWIVADGYLNLLERQQAEALLQIPSVNDLTTVIVNYKLVPDAVTCDGSLPYHNNVPMSSDSALTLSGSYKVCVQAKDIFNQSSYGSGPSFVYDTGTVTVSMSSLPAAVGSSVSMAAVAAGTDVSHYKAKVGMQDSTDCFDSSGYSQEYEVSVPFIFNYGSLNDGSLVLCAIGRNVSGNWQSPATAFQYSWILDREAPLQVEDFIVSSLTERVKFNWSAVSGAVGYIIARSNASGPISWTPSNGQAYAQGQTIGSDLKIVSVGSSRPTFDNDVDPNTSYEYAVFAYDLALNYSLPASGSAIPTAAIAMNVANGFDRSVRRIVPAPDASGKYYVAGDFLVYGQRAASRLLRFNSDMTVDTSFNPPLFNNVIYALATSADGKLYVGGAFTSFTGFIHNRLVRLHGDGSVDADFNVGTGFNSTVQSLALDETLNRLYVGGAFTSYKGVTASRLTALSTASAAVDSSFSCGTCITSPSSATVNAMVVIPGQGLYLGGSFTNLNGVSTNRIARVSASGTRDATFTGTGFDNTVLTLAVDSSGNVYAGGSFSKYRGSSNGYRFTRLIAETGAIDSSLPVTNKFNGTVHSIHLDASGNVYVGGDFTAFGSNAAIRLALLSPAGALNLAFTANAPVMSGVGANAGFPVTTIHSNADHIFVGGSFQRLGTSNVAYFARLSLSGTITTGVLQGTMMNSSVYSMIPTNVPGEKLVAGYFTSYRGQQAYRIARISKEGVRDAGVANSITSAAYVYALAMESSTGKFYAGGTFTAPSGRLARFNSNGSIDSTFNSVITTTGFNSDVYALAHDPATGAIYVGGKFTTLKTAGMATAQTVNYLVRLLPTGYRDTTFQTGTGFNGQVNALKLMSDGSLLVGGSFTSFNGTSANRLIRLNPDGSIHEGLDIGTGFNGAVQAIHYVANEDSLYVCGAFTSYQGVAANRLIRLTSLGTPAAAWSFGSGLSGTAYALDWDENNEVLWVGGNFGTVRGVSSPRMTALNRDGSLHTAFSIGTGFNGDIRALSADAWGLMFGGTASTYQSAPIDYFGRLIFNGSVQ